MPETNLMVIPQTLPRTVMTAAIWSVRRSRWLCDLFGDCSERRAADLFGQRLGIVTSEHNCSRELRKVGGQESVGGQVFRSADQNPLNSARRDQFS